MIRSARKKCDSYSSLFHPVRHVALVTCLFAPHVSAQQPGSPPIRDPSNPVVMLSVIVTDKSNHSVDDVSRDDLQVFEGGKLQKLQSFSREEKPVKYTIAIDMSLSFKNLVGASLLAANLIITQNRPEDETALVRFISSDKINTEQAFTSDKSKLLEALKQFYVDEGQSAVIDVVYLAVESTKSYKSEDPGARRALVLISDGEDRHSYYSQDALVKLLRRSNVQIFVIGMVSELDKDRGLMRASPRDRSEGFLKLLAQETGGRVFFPRNIGDLQAAAKEIAHDLHLQFSVGYELAEPGAKSFHKVEIKTVGQRQLTAITRSGYFGLSYTAKENKKAAP